jgi:outer membrane cobalamin receptor
LKIWWDKFFIQPALHFYYGEGMLGQKLTAFYPHISLGYRLTRQTTLVASYKGEVRRATLAGQLEVYPYLSAKTLLRHTNVQADIVGAIETDWNEVWRTRFSARYQSIRDLPLYNEPFGQGIGSFVFVGRTRIATYQADIFAKFSANSYFTVSVAVNSTKNLITNAKIPYVSDFELSASWLYTFPFGLAVTPRANFVDRRNIDVFSGANMPEYWLFGVRAEYPIFERLGAFIDLHNLLDRNYDEWRGYRATPFLMQAGLSFRW